MALMASATSSSNFQALEPGSYLARIVRVLDLGTQESELYGDKHQVLIMFEVASERRRFQVDGEEKEGPAVQSAFWTLSAHEKSNLRACYEACVGPLAEGADFRLDALLDRPCQIQVGLTTTGKAKIASVMGLARGLKVPPADLPLLYLEVTKDGYRAEDFEKIPPGIRAIIERSPEWQMVTGALAKQFPVPGDPGEPPPHTDDDFVEPF